MNIIDKIRNTKHVLTYEDWITLYIVGYIYFLNPLNYNFQTHYNYNSMDLNSSEKNKLYIVFEKQNNNYMLFTDDFVVYGTFSSDVRWRLEEAWFPDTTTSRKSYTPRD